MNQRSAMKSGKMPPSTLVAVPILATAILLSAAVAAGQNAPNDFLAPHNSARAAVNVGPMTWNATVAAYAEQYANYRSGSCDLVHSSGPYGENLFSGTGRDWSAADAVRAWVDEGKDYDYASNSCAAGKVCGHYTQVVWAASTDLGCAAVPCGSAAGESGVFIICSYSPPGNYIGERPY
ncbi:hypothetical protein HPP92_018650 [Vanilla planifolia]|uniref:SCP domain-containing protein n=1 Tax=Vanilla planifolia TaxID=51239 RepID=A0A835QA83_VANPL|nr:hypothetical protein HPP92_018650 [Vanilla planifolia]